VNVVQVKDNVVICDNEEQAQEMLALWSLTKAGMETLVPDPQMRAAVRDRLGLGSQDYVFWSHHDGVVGTYLGAEVNRESEDGMLILVKGWGNTMWVRPAFRTSVENGKRISEALEAARAKLRERHKQSLASFEGVRDSLAPWR
jgi:hypothetical protein